jgi:hypothetical protein
MSSDPGCEENVEGPKFVPIMMPTNPMEEMVNEILLKDVDPTKVVFVCPNLDNSCPQGLRDYYEKMQSKMLESKPAETLQDL